MFARWDKMSKQFARIGKEITIAVKASGPNPEANPGLKRAMQNARAVNMPKDKVESAIKRASGQNATHYEQVLYEGYAPHGIAVLVETATDNTARTVSNVRTLFNKGGGNLANTGSWRSCSTTWGSSDSSRRGSTRTELELERSTSGSRRWARRPARRAKLNCSSAAPTVTSGRCRSARGSRHQPDLGRTRVRRDHSRRAVGRARLAEVLQLVDKVEQDDDVQRVFHNLG